jgi:ribose 5-phosphate isomerase A
VSNEREKQLAAEASVALVEDGMTVGLGTGSTVAYLLPALAARGLSSIRCVATSPRTEDAARALGLTVSPFGSIDRFDIAIDGADEVTPDGWLIKGGGAAHTREKVVAEAVPALRGTVPVEMLEYGLAATMRHLQPVALRDVPRSPDGGVIADYSGSVDDPATLAAFLSATPGVVEHGLFPPELVHDVFIARGEDVEHRHLR